MYLQLLSKKVRYMAGKAAFYIFEAVVPRVPIKFWLWFSRWATNATSMLFPPSLSYIKKNIKSFYGTEISEKEAKGIAKKAASSLLFIFFETIYYASRPKLELTNRLTIEDHAGLEYYKSSGKGVILVSGHLGAFVLLGSCMGLSNYPFILLVKLSNDSFIECVYRDYIKRLGITASFLPRSLNTQEKQSLTKEIIERVKNGGMVCFLVDESEKQGGIPVRLFSKTVALAAGPFLLKLRYGFDLIPIYMSREGCKYTIHIDPPLAPDLSREKKEKGRKRELMQAVAQSYATYLEKLVRSQPTLWVWLNKPVKPKLRGPRT